MRSGEVVQLLAGLGAMLAVVLVFGRAMRAVGMPALMAELIGGIVLGPTILGAAAPDVSAWLLPSTGAAAVARDGVIKFGLILFLVLAGLEVELKHIADGRKAIVTTSLLGMLFPFTAGYASVLLWPDLWGVPGDVDVVALLVGTILSISALPVIARILFDLNMIRTRLGTQIMSAATIDDLAGWGLFALILGQSGRNAGHGGNRLVTAGLIIVLVALVMTLGTERGRRVLAWVRRRVDGSNSYLPVVALVVLLSAAAAEQIGTHAVFGGFLVGVALARTNEARRQTYEALRPIALEVFAPLYLVSIGLRADFASNFDIGLFGLVLAVATVGKVAGAGLGSLIGGNAPRDALTVGVAMNARGLMGIVLTTIALDYELIDERVFVALTLMAVITSVFGAYAIQRIQRIPSRHAGLVESERVHRGLT
jgi:Kef-type K+ transport system membrane component KefB